MRTRRERIYYLDIARGISILAVIWGHIMLSGWTNVLVYAFDIPLFLFLSGMMFHPDRIKTFAALLKRLFRKLLVPYFLFGTGTYFVWLLYNHVIHREIKSYTEPFLQLFLAYGSSDYIRQDPPLWFVTCLVVIQILYFLFRKYTNETTTVLLSVGCGILGYILVGHNLVELPWNFESAMSAMPFFCAGNLFAAHAGYDGIIRFYDDHKKKLLLPTILFSVVFIIGALWNGHITLGSNVLGKSTLVLYLIGAIGIYLVLITAVFIYRTLKPAIYRGIMWFGENSFFVMAAHIPIKRFIVAALASAMDVKRSTIQNAETYSLIAFVFSVAITAVVVEILNICVRKVKIRHS